MRQPHYMELLAEELGLEVARKAAMTLSDLNTYSLKREDADRFIDQVVDESILLRSIRVHRTDAPAGDISKLSITGPITAKATENTVATNTKKPTNAVVSYATVKSVSCIDISGEVQEDNIEGPAGRNTIMGTVTKQVANDMEQMGLEGDVTTAGATALALLLKTNDGYNTLTAADAAVHDVDAGGGRISFALLVKMMRTMPTKWKRNLNQLRWIMSTNCMLDLAEEWGGRSTDLGDTLRKTGMLPPILGVTVLPVPLMPEDLAITGTGSGAGTVCYLVDPNNFIYVVQRDLTVEWERVPRSDTDEGTIHMRTDFVYEEGDAITKANNITTDTSVDRYS